MTGALVGGAFLSGFINVVFDRLLTVDAVNLVLGKKLGSDLVERLKISLLAAEALVDDAEYKQLGDERVREWLNCLKDAVYIADDLLDDVLTKEATQKKVLSFLPSFLDRKRKMLMVNKMEEVVTRIEFLQKQKDLLGLEKSTKRNFLSWRIPSTSLVEGSIYGREKDQQEIIKILNETREHQLSVISIVGIGGVGKTTLAQWLYNNEDLMDRFQIKKWVCISEDFNIAKVTKNIIGQDGCNTDDFNCLQHELKKTLLGKKFFIVLDDVWSNDGDVWKKFITPFQYGANGMFANNACFPESNGSLPLEEIGRKIVKKCKGLPLAAETLGRMLRMNHNVKEWERVLISNIWEFSVEKSKIIPALLISYFQLPAYLKRCFVYCSLYPKDYCFTKDDLILLWMAEDLLRPPKRGESLEEVGHECFVELAFRLFFKQDGDGYVYKMHDLLHDLAIFLAGDFYCRFEKVADAEYMSSHIRHLSCESLNHLNLDSFSKIKSLRTLLQINFSSLSDNIDAVTCILMLKLKYLRVLSFKMLDVLPDSIGGLIYLRYLDLSWTNIRTLPESLCDLCNLQTLKLHNCTSLIMLPNGMHKLVNLRHLDIWGTCLKEMPRKMSKLKHLHIFSYFTVGKHKDNGIQELGELSNLHGSFGIKKLENIVDVKEAKSAKIMDKMHIDCLSLEWFSSDDMVLDTQIERDILDSLRPHNGLKELTIEGYKGTIFPNWVGHCSYQNMTSVSLKSCNNCCMLPSLGQLPSLKSLHIEGFGQLKYISDEFYKNEDNPSFHIAHFPSLEKLEFRDMPCWEMWHLPDSETFPQLKRLLIRDCPMLKGDVFSQAFLKILSSLSDVSKVRKLDISERCSQEMSLTGDNLSIGGCESIVKSAFEAISINHLTCLQEIQISGCLSAVSLPGNCLPESLQKLAICSSGKLEFPEQHQQKYDLVELQIHSSCDSLTSLSLDAFPNLKNLEIHWCENVESVSLSQPPHTALQHLSIIGCPKFVSFPGEGLAAPNLTSLHVKRCSKLEELPRDMNTLLPNLESLEMQHCQEICMFPEGGLPPNLKSLTVGGCKQQLRSVSSMGGNFESLTHLEISGVGCESVKSFHEIGSLPHLPSITTLVIRGFSNLETLECNELLGLTSLLQLRIGGCPNLENMVPETKGMPLEVITEFFAVGARVRQDASAKSL
nr:putative disease resistance protein At3g14460 [Arachis hypogaea]